MDGLAHELGAAVEQVREDAFGARIVESLGQELDLDEVLARCAEAAAALHGVAGALAEIEIEGGRLVAAAGLAGAASSTVGGPPGRRARQRRRDLVSLRRCPGRAGAAAGGDRRADRVGRPACRIPHRVRPQRGATRDRGRLRDARGDRPSCRAGSRSARERKAAPVALRATRSRACPTGRRCTRRSRSRSRGRIGSGRPLTLCVLDLHDFKQVNADLGHVAADGVLTEVARAPRGDGPEHTAYRCGGDEFAVIMPGARRIDGEALSARLQGSLGRAAGSRAEGVGVTRGLAEVKADDDGVSLYERAERDLRRSGGDEGAGTQRRTTKGWPAGHPFEPLRCYVAATPRPSPPAARPRRGCPRRRRARGP